MEYGVATEFRAGRGRAVCLKVDRFEDVALGSEAHDLCGLLTGESESHKIGQVGFRGRSSDFFQLARVGCLPLRLTTWESHSRIVRAKHRIGEHRDPRFGRLAGTELLSQNR